MLSILPFPIWAIIKIFFIIGLLVYLVFALVVVRQAKLMTATISMGFEAPIKILSYLHLIFAVIVLVLSVIIL